MKLETDYGDVQLLLETIKSRAGEIVKFADEAMNAGLINREEMNKQTIYSKILPTAFAALNIHFKMKEQENGTKTN